MYFLHRSLPLYMLPVSSISPESQGSAYVQTRLLSIQHNTPLTHPSEILFLIKRIVAPGTTEIHTVYLHIPPRVTLPIVFHLIILLKLNTHTYSVDARVTDNLNCLYLPSLSSGS